MTHLLQQFHCLIKVCCCAFKVFSVKLDLAPLKVKTSLQQRHQAHAAQSVGIEHVAAMQVHVHAQGPWQWLHLNPIVPPCAASTSSTLFLDSTTPRPKRLQLRLLSVACGCGLPGDWSYPIEQLMSNHKKHAEIDPASDRHSPYFKFR